MKFTKVIGYSEDPAVKKSILEAQERLSSCFTELSLSSENKGLGSGLGGDALLFQLLYPLPHLVDVTANQLEELKVIKDTIQEKAEKENRELNAEEQKQVQNYKDFKKSLGPRGALTTAATDGKRFYWNPDFVNKLSKIGLRLVVGHEAWHAIFMHVGRRKARHPIMWNIAVDYRVNFSMMQDLKARDIRDYEKVFKENLGDYILLEEYADFLRDPFNPPAKLAHMNPMEGLKKKVDPEYQSIGDDKSLFYADANLSDDMKRPENVYEYLWKCIPRCPKCGKMGKYKKPDAYKELEKKLKEKQKAEAEAKAKAKAEGKDPSDQKGEQPGEEEGNQPGNNPGSQMSSQGGKPDPNHKCDDDCDHKHGEKSDSGKGEAKADGAEGDSSSPGDQPGEGQPGEAKDDSCNPDGSCDSDGGGCGDDQGCGSCGECGGDDSEYIDPFGAGDLLDDHMDTDVSEEELGKRITDAMEVAKRMAGRIPGALEDELGKLINPKISWQDIIRAKMFKIKQGHGKNDWTRPKNKPLFAGLYTPKKKNIEAKILVAYDTSGSMSQEDISFGISQMQAIGSRAECYLLPWDTQPYWEKMIKINKADAESLSKAIVKGRGGTCCNLVFQEYKEHCKEIDIIVCITDGYLFDKELDGVQLPKGVDVVWLITSHNPNFKPKFGKVLHLRND